MIEVTAISFKENGQVYYFLNDGLNIKDGDNVIIQTERGLQFGYVRESKIEIPKSKLKSPLKFIVRIADQQDLKQHNKNIKDASLALDYAKKIVLKHNLKMQLIDAMYTLDKDKLIFRFLSDARIDFRNLARELANKYKTRIELRQIGARDKAKEIGGCGHCGRNLCCSSFLNNMDSVTISMAKNQNVSLNPTKINGLCGRLLCCLSYEDEQYKKCKKEMPSVGQVIKTKHGSGKVISIDVLNQKYKVDVEKMGIIEVNKCDECH